MTTNKLLQIDSTGKQVAGVGVPSGTDINGAGKVVSIQGVTADFTSTPPATGQLGGFVGSPPVFKPVDAPTPIPDPGGGNIGDVPALASLSPRAWGLVAPSGGSAPSWHDVIRIDDFRALASGGTIDMTAGGTFTFTSSGKTITATTGGGYVDAITAANGLELGGSGTPNGGPSLSFNVDAHGYVRGCPLRITHCCTWASPSTVKGGCCIGGGLNVYSLNNGSLVQGFGSISQNWVEYIDWNGFYHQLQVYSPNGPGDYPGHNTTHPGDNSANNNPCHELMLPHGYGKMFDYEQTALLRAFPAYPVGSQASQLTLFVQVNYGSQYSYKGTCGQNSEAPGFVYKDGTLAWDFYTQAMAGVPCTGYYTSLLIEQWY